MDANSRTCFNLIRWTQTWILSFICILKLLYFSWIIVTSEPKKITKACEFFILGFFVVTLFRMPKVNDRNSGVAHKDVFRANVTVEDARTMYGLQCQ